MAWDMVDVNELEGEGPGGAVRFVRRRLEVQAFGINWFELPPNFEGRATTSRGRARRRST